MNMYQNARIYRIVGGGKTYYGSTCVSLSRRLTQHRSDYKRYKEGATKSMTSFSLLEEPDYDIFLVELFPCDTKEELRARERWWIENNECVNKTVPTRSGKEYRKDNRAKISEINKAYYEANRDKRLERINLNKRIRRMFGYPN